MAKKAKGPPKMDGDLIFTMFFRHWRTGKIVRRKDGKPFCFPRRRRKA